MNTEGTTTGRFSATKENKSNTPKSNRIFSVCLHQNDFCTDGTCCVCGDSYSNRNEGAPPPYLCDPCAQEIAHTVITPLNKKPTHPLQPLYLDKHKTIRFKKNEIVRFLLDAGPFDLNQLALMTFTNEDRAQLAQLIGYSLSGFSELSYVSDKVYDTARVNALPLVNKLTKEKRTA